MQRTDAMNIGKHRQASSIGNVENQFSAMCMRAKSDMIYTRRSTMPPL